MDRERHELSTADLAQRGDQLRGRSEEEEKERARTEQERARTEEAITGRSDEEIRARATPDGREASRPGPPVAVRSATEETHGATSGTPRISKMGEAAGDSSLRTRLLPEDETERLWTRWGDVQGTFVDTPRQAVAEADALVADLMKRIAAVFADERANLERQWDRGNDVTTEDLRVALQRYRVFFDRLLSV